MFEKISTIFVAEIHLVESLGEIDTFRYRFEVSRKKKKIVERLVIRLQIRIFENLLKNNRIFIKNSNIIETTILHFI